MGTRSLTYVYQSYKDGVGNKVNEPIICLYRQWDGYPEGHGAELASFLKSGNIVNGLGVGDAEGVWNGMGCMAAQLVAYFKKEPGNFYLHAPILNRDDWQDYEYHVFDDKVIVYQMGSNNDNVIFEGSYANFYKFCNKTSKGIDVEAQEKVKDALRDGIVEISFTKTDGTLRTMRCTLSEGKIPSEHAPKGTRAPSGEAQPVFDLDAQHWKSFRWDSLISAFEV
jgi:WYL_2, Sm-like SH3 beta-barrel fold